MSEEIEAEIKQFLVDEVLEGPEFAELPVDAPLLGGVLDSFALVTLIDYLEDRFEISIDNDEMVKENFASVEAVAAFVEEKRAPSDPPA
jgi:acyl carrier protein